MSNVNISRAEATRGFPFLGEWLQTNKDALVLADRRVPSPQERAAKIGLTNLRRGYRSVSPQWRLPYIILNACKGDYLDSFGVELFGNEVDSSFQASASAVVRKLVQMNDEGVLNKTNNLIRISIPLGQDLGQIDDSVIAYTTTEQGLRIPIPGMQSVRTPGSPRLVPQLR